MRHVYLFQPRFAPLVESGAKRCTVRPIRVRLPEPGEILSLRAWIGQPYRSKQRLLREAPCLKVSLLLISLQKELLILQSEGALNHQQADEFAVADGFGSFSEMLTWIRKTHGAANFAGFATYW